MNGAPHPSLPDLAKTAEARRAQARRESRIVEAAGG